VISDRVGLRRRRPTAIAAAVSGLPWWVLALLGAAGLLALTAGSGVSMPWNHTESVWLHGWLVEVLLPPVR
jgi:hypothetical protein